MGEELERHRSRAKVMYFYNNVAEKRQICGTSSIGRFGII
jgi:hypothetical protein